MFKGLRRKAAVRRQWTLLPHSQGYFPKSGKKKKKRSV